MKSQNLFFFFINSGTSDFILLGFAILVSFVTCFSSDVSNKSMEDNMHEENRGANDMQLEEHNGFHFLEVHPHRGGIKDLIKYYVWGDIRSGVKFLEGSHSVRTGAVAADHKWVILVSIIARKIIMFFGKPLEWTGIVVEFLLNLISRNGGFLGLVCNVIRGTVDSLL